MNINEQLHEELTKLISVTSEGVGQASEFLVAEIPDVLYQLLLWHGAYNAILCFVGFCLFGSVVLVWKYVSANYKNTEHVLVDSLGDAFLLYVFSGLYTIVALSISLPCINLTWLQIWIAPKVFLIEYISKLVGG